MKEYLSERPGLIALLLAVTILVWMVVSVVFPLFFVFSCGVLIGGMLFYILGIICMAVGEEVAQKLRR